MELYDGTWCPPPAQIETAQGDPNSVAPHFDVIREALKFKASSILATDAERQQSQDLLDQIYKEVPPADPEARRPSPWES